MGAHGPNIVGLLVDVKARQRRPALLLLLGGVGHDAAPCGTTCTPALLSIKTCSERECHVLFEPLGVVCVWCLALSEEKSSTWEESAAL